MLPGTIGLWLLAQRRWPAWRRAVRRDATLLGILHALGVTVGLAMIAGEFMISRFRSIWIACLFAFVLVSAMVHERRVVGLAYPTVAVTAIGLALVVGLIPRPVVDRALSIFDSTAPDVLARQEVVGRLLPLADDNPVVGIGFNNSRYFLPEELVAARVDAIHNIVLSNLVENGILAAIVLVAMPMIVWMLYLGLRRCGDPQVRYLGAWDTASFLGIYIGAQLTTGMLEYAFWFLMAYVAGLATRPVEAAIEVGPITRVAEA